MLSLQEISDRLEIEELLVRYSHALDSKDWDAWEALFTPDAVIDYTEMGGIRGGVHDVRVWLEEVMAWPVSYQHLVADTLLDFGDDDHVRARTICHNPMVLDDGKGGTHVFFCGLWYVDRLVRTPAGWRFAERREERSYFHNTPEGMPLPG